MGTQYCKNYTGYNRRTTSRVKVGNLFIGSEFPVSVQTMTNTNTADIDATTQQILLAASTGAELVRVTVPSIRDVENLSKIKDSVREKGISVPIVADVHFNQKIAFEAAKIVDKVRINPGNFSDSKKSEIHEYNPAEYEAELIRVKKDFLPLLEICKKHNTALRIGTNHGSLSDRIMSRFGDTPEGMAESAMEFLRICKSEKFENVLISMKASNTMVMVQATRLLVAKMTDEGMNYPLHLGVTEAGEGEDGRIKSAVGIGTLLADGIGDTIRVSLTEPPECEIPVAKMLTGYFSERTNHPKIEEFGSLPINPFRFSRRKSVPVFNIGGNSQLVVISGSDIKLTEDQAPDWTMIEGEQKVLKQDKSNFLPLYKWDKNLSFDREEPALIVLFADEVNAVTIEKMSQLKNKIIGLETRNKNGFADQRAAIFRLMNGGIDFPVILKRDYKEQELGSFQIKSAADIGGLLLDGLADGIWLENKGPVSQADIISASFSILQASRMRMTKTEYISCPSCGRTMFNLQETTRLIREKTSHLKKLKIGIMGCIVNGPGEMADADYGYIGSGKGKINLYYNKELIKKGISEENAVEELINLIKEKGDWIDSFTK